MNLNFTESQSKKIAKVCEQGLAFCFYALIFFLPISIALVEIFCGLAIFLFLVKRTVGLLGKRMALHGMGDTEKPENPVMVFYKAYKPKDSYLNIAVLIWTVVNFASIFFSKNLPVSMMGFLGKTLQGVFVYITFLEGINTRKRLRVFLSVFLASFVLIHINGLVQYFTGTGFIFNHPKIDGRIMSSLRQMNDYAAYILVFLPVFISVLIVGGKQAERYARGMSSFSFVYKAPAKLAAFVVLCMALACLGFTFSRGAWLGLVFGLILLSIMDKRTIYAGLIIGILFFLIFFPKLMSDRVQFTDLQSLMVNNNRFCYWPAAIEIIKQNPVIGVGVNAFSEVAKNMDFEWTGYPHNCYLHMAAETGILGLLSFLGMQGVLFFKAFRENYFIEEYSIKVIKHGFMAGLLGFLAHAFFDTTMYSTQLNTLMWLVMSLIVVIDGIWVKEAVESTI